MLLKKSTLVVVTIAAIGVVALLVARRGEKTQPPAEPTSLLSPADLPVDAVRRITLQRAGALALVFERGEAGWTQVEPFAYPMDPYSIRQFAALAIQLVSARRLEEGSADPAELGLAPPRAVVTYEWPEGSLSLQFGRSAVGGRSYVRVGGDPTVHLAGGELCERAVQVDPKEWRDRTIFPGVSVEADEIVIDQGAARTVLRRDRKQWRVVEPVRTRMDSAGGNDLFTALGRARSGGFILDSPDDLSKFGFDAPAASFEVRTGDDVQRLLVGGRMGVGVEDRFGIVEGRPVVVRLPAAVLRALFRPAAELIDRTASGVPAADVKSLVIRSPGGDLTLTRDLDRWKSGDVFVETRPVEVLLDRLTTQRAIAVEIQPYPRADEVATITLLGFGGRPLDTVRVARDPRSGQWVLDNGDNVLRLHPAETHLPLASADFGLTP